MNLLVLILFSFCCLASAKSEAKHLSPQKKLLHYSQIQSSVQNSSILKNDQKFEAPESIEGACDDNTCTPQMEAIYSQFLKFTNAPMFIPGMYSGDCYHQSQMLAPETKHYVGLLIDNHPKGHYMAPIFQFFGEDNDMKDWTLQQARDKASPDWKNYGPMKIHPTSATQFVLDADGYPVYIYWARQDPESKKIYFLAFARGLSLAFCETHPNAGGL